MFKTSKSVRCFEFIDLFWIRGGVAGLLEVYYSQLAMARFMLASVTKVHFG